MVPQQRAEPRSAVLVIRAWIEPGPNERVRARLLNGCPENPSGGVQWDVAAGEDAICEAVGRWVAELVEPPAPPGPPGCEPGPPGLTPGSAASP